MSCCVFSLCVMLKEMIKTLHLMSGAGSAVRSIRFGGAGVLSAKSLDRRRKEQDHKAALLTSCKHCPICL